MLSREVPCCDAMAFQLNHVCEQHPDRFDCPDALVGTFADGRVGLIVHDGGSSMVLIAFCPWCGTPTGTTLDN
jgi:hypothetical protein